MNAPKSLVEQVVAENFDRYQQEQKLDRIAAMPDLLERYDAFISRLGRLEIISDWLGHEIEAASRDGNPYPAQLANAVAFLGREIEDARKGAEA